MQMTSERWLLRGDEHAYLAATSCIRLVGNVKGVPVTLRKQLASVAQECSDIRLEQVKKFKTGYWMTTWTLNHLLVAFGVGVAFHQTLALDECVGHPQFATRCPSMRVGEQPRVPPAWSALDLHSVAPIRVQRQRTSCRPTGFPTSVSGHHGASYTSGIHTASFRYQAMPAHRLDLRL